MRIIDNNLRAFLREMEGIVTLQKIAEYSYAVLLPKAWVDFCTDEIKADDNKTLRLVKLSLQEGSDALIIEPVTEARLVKLLETVKEKRHDDWSRGTIEDNQCSPSYDKSKG